MEVRGSSTFRCTDRSRSSDCVVVGVGGLAVAYMLCNAGHCVRVLEKRDYSKLPCSGHRLPPNVSKILRQWVGEEELRKLSVRCMRTRFNRCEYFVLSLGRFIAPMVSDVLEQRIGMGSPLSPCDLLLLSYHASGSDTRLVQWKQGSTSDISLGRQRSWPRRAVSSS